MGSAKTHTMCGTPEYLSPEQAQGLGHNQAVDVWAFGILVYEMLAGVSPFSDGEDTPQEQLFDNIIKRPLQFLKVGTPIPADCQDLVRRLLVRDVTARPEAQEITKHPWFASIDFRQYSGKKLVAPWIPKVSSTTDTSHFVDDQEEEEGAVGGARLNDHPDDGPVVVTDWDENF